MTGSEAGSVSFATSPEAATDAPKVTFLGVVSVDDETMVDSRLVNIDGVGGGAIVLNDGGTSGDGESLLDTGLGTQFSFVHPADVLTLNGSTGPDTFDLHPIHALRAAGLTVNGALCPASMTVLQTSS